MIEDDDSVYRRGHRSSSSTLSSHRSDEGGGKLKRSFKSCSSMSRFPTAPLPLNGITMRRQNFASSISLQNKNRASMPIIGVTTRSSKKNEDWDLAYANPRDMYKDISFHGLKRPQTKPSLEGASQNQINERLRELERNSPTESLKKGHIPLTSSSQTTQNVGNLPATPSPVVDASIISNEELDETSKTRDLHHRDVLTVTCISTDMHTHANVNILSVTFAETHKEILIDGPSDDMNIKWYSASDNDQFLNDSKARSTIVDRTMSYASLNESTYNSSTGLTAPSVLKEYLSSPEEIIGIEHLISGQKNARESLKGHHKSVLFKELRRQRQEGCADPLLLAERLRHTSNIASHMAQERATYTTLLD